jgi:hypothetical protein
MHNNAINTDSKKSGAPSSRYFLLQVMASVRTSPYTIGNATTRRRLNLFRKRFGRLELFERIERVQ